MNDPMQLHHVEYGSGTSVLGLHGWPADHRVASGALEPVFAQLPGYRRIYPDLPGMGHSALPPTVKSTDDIVDALQDFIDTSIGVEPFLLAGVSYGAYLARAITRLRRDQVRGLALICPVADPLERRSPPQTVLRSDPDLLASLSPEDALYPKVAVVQSSDTLRRFHQEVAAGISLADHSALARIQRQWRLSVDPERENGTSFPRPTLIVAGRQDHWVGYIDQFDLLEQYPRATFAVLDVAGHGLQWEQPELLRSLTVEWLDRVNNWSAA